MEQKLDFDLQEATLQTVDLEKELLVLRLAFGKLKAAVSDALAPLSAGLVNALSGGVFWAIRLAKQLGQLITALTGFRVAQKATEKTVVTTAKAIKRSLAGFDEINRIGENAGSKISQKQVQLPRVSMEIDPEIQKIADGILAAIRPLTEIDLLPLRWNFHRLKESVQELAAVLGSGLKWVWEEILVPFVTWTAERLIPTCFDTLQRGVELVTAALKPLGEGFAQIYESLKPLVDFAGTLVLNALTQLRSLFVSLTGVMWEKSGVISAVFENIARQVQRVMEIVMPILQQLKAGWLTTFQNLKDIAAKVLGSVISGFYGLTEYLAGVFTGNWKRAFSGLQVLVKNTVNGIIGVINALLSGLSSGLNAFVKAANTLKFTLPDWIPVLGGKKFGLSLPTVKTPQIPYLAQGAVLPANRPFLAVVGDQKHGTNIEAPLATIQEAVAGVMGDFAESNLAGHEATVGVLSEILQAVLGISIGDQALYNAVSRYGQKLSVVRGGQAFGGIV